MDRLPQTFSPPDLFETGMGVVIIIRHKSGGRIEAGVFLLDVYCLGVKNAFFNQFHESEFDAFFEKMYDGRLTIENSGAWGRKLVEGAVAYARNLGFAPHRDYKLGARVMGGISAKECEDTFTYGSEGKPFFISGPNESDARIQLILKALERKCGPKGSNFLIPMPTGE